MVDFLSFSAVMFSVVTLQVKLGICYKLFNLLTFVHAMGMILVSHFTKLNKLKQFLSVYLVSVTCLCIVAYIGADACTFISIYYRSVIIMAYIVCTVAV